MTKLKTTLILLSGIGLGTVLALKTAAIAKPATEALPLEELRTFSRVFNQIKQSYVEPVSDKELINNAIAGMVSSLDPHSAYLPPENFKELTINTTGKFGGLGIEVSMEDGFVKVISPIDDTPAMRAGVKAGDLIIRIDNKPVKGLTLNEAVKLMRGKVGTAIEVTIVREGTDKPLKIKIIRDVIKIRSVKARLLEPQLGYVRISQFQSQTTRNLNIQIHKITDEAKDKKLKGLILDLRNNPGGTLTGAVGVSNAFLKQGKIVYTEGRTEDAKSVFRATADTFIPDIPLVVIINSGSASASEIVAGALQDYKRALIVGEKSFGKGSVQTVMPLTRGAGLKITTARYFTPKGRSIQAKGIIPDIVIKPQEIKNPVDDGSKALLYSERDLTGHLENPNNADDKKGSQKQQSKKKDKPVSAKKKAKDIDLIHKDFVLHEALNLLKGIAFSQK